MALIAKESGGGGEFTPVPQGMHLARCYRIVDLGTQDSTYLGTVKKLPKVMLQFEVHGEDDAGKAIVTAKNEPMSISKNFTLSLAEKATLRKDLQTWRGREFTEDELRGFELKNVLGAWAMVSVIKAMGNNGKEYTNIAAIMSVPPAIKKAGMPQGHNELKLFSIDEPDMALFDIFSNGLKEKIGKSPEWQSRGNVDYQKEQNASAKGSGFDDMDDDIPFN
tara:strand:- start:18034 stop:18696 length:663 start_codon:yes stop_codon:yes gene_type:complete